MKCKICDNQSSEWDKAVVLNKYPVQYYRCKNCGFIQTENTYWMDEAYSEAIAPVDIGLVSRNIKFAAISKTMIEVFFDHNLHFLDYGRRYGLFIRLMRDCGYSFHGYDLYGKNLFASNWEIDCLKEESVLNSDLFELVTGFEVIEHLNEPLIEIEKLLHLIRSFFFSTLLIPPVAPKVTDWWYFAPEFGQHISIFSLDSLKFIAGRFNLNLYSNGKDLHLLTRRTLSPILFRVFTAARISHFVNHFIHRKSLLPQDFAEIREKSMSK